MDTTQQIRKGFIDYFSSNGHTNVESSSLIPHNDPTLMFVNAGMVQFKNLFTGLEKREYNKAVTSQKCVRAGGKHNDLENVGYTARHHTFFEMLGNFSFGNYFKEEAILYAWKFLTKELSIPKEKLYVTVYHTDSEAEKLWKKISGFSDDRIIKISTNDNFWSMGDSGPCGPCSEIFYDHGEHVFGGLPGTKDEDGDRFVEIWNMVFMEFNAKADGTRSPLPAKSIDTGIGLERLSAIMQGVHNNYDIDLFKNIISSSEQVTGKVGEDYKFSHRIIADHLRSMSFLVADGVMPSNEGRGYVLRRIMRRAMRHAYQLGCKDPLMYKLLPTLVSNMGEAFPELVRAEHLITEVLKLEEENFRTTLGKGLKLLDEELSQNNSSLFSGKVAFKLYDTYGFPLDLTEDILRSRNVNVDHKAFDHSMQEQKTRARKAWAGSGENASSAVWLDLKDKYGSTEFLGYSLNAAEGEVLEVLDFPTENNKQAKAIITNQTPFYAEAGGQMGDVGYIANSSFKATVVDTKKFEGLHVHIVELVEGEVNKGDIVDLTIDIEYRNNLRINHSATHILHAVLREVLGEHVTQKGSLVSVDKLRFDFSHTKSVTEAELKYIEDKINKLVRNNTEVHTKLMSTKDAIKQGAMALFGEKYENEVRVVSMSDLFSIELCGGTHVTRTGDIGSFRIISESAVASGVRRIEAICGFFADQNAYNVKNNLLKIADSLKVSTIDINDKINKLQQDNKNLTKELMAIKAAQLSYNKERISSEAKTVNGIRVIVNAEKDLDIKACRSSVEQAIKIADDLIMVFVVNNAGKINIIVGVSKDIADKIKASECAQKISEHLGGKGGGGSPTLAQAGGVDIEKIAGVKGYIHQFLENR